MTLREIQSPSPTTIPGLVRERADGIPILQRSGIPIHLVVDRVDELFDKTSDVHGIIIRDWEGGIMSEEIDASITVFQANPDSIIPLIEENRQKRGNINPVTLHKTERSEKEH